VAGWETPVCWPQRKKLVADGREERQDDAKRPVLARAGEPHSMTRSDTSLRKLTAIMFTDMVGYSALAQRNEALALELLEEQRQLFRPIFLTHQGREIKSTGDGFLVDFSSALAATLCGIELQRTMIQRNAASPPDRRFQIRIGVHVGDVEYREADMFGDGVNIAARIEPLAEAGGICLSRAVADQIQNKISSRLVKLDTPRLKNIQTPTEVFRVVLPWEEQSTPAEPTTALPPRRRVTPRAILSGSALLLILLCLGLVLKLGRPLPTTDRPPPAAADSRPSPNPPVVAKAGHPAELVVLEEKFEDLEWPKSWDFTVPNGLKIYTKESRGNHFLQIESTGDDETAAIARTVKLDPRWKTLKVAYRLKTENLRKGPSDWSGAIVNLVWKDTPVNQIEWMGAGGSEGDTNWTTFESTHPIPAEAAYAMVVVSLVKAKGSMSFDDLRLSVAEEGERGYSLWTNLFNGRDFSGWRILAWQSNMWSVTDEVILCDSSEGPGSSTDLVWEGKVDDFDLRFSYKLMGAQEVDRHSAAVIYRGTDTNQYALTLGREGIIFLRGLNRHLASAVENLATAGEKSVAKDVNGNDTREVVGSFGTAEQMVSVYKKDDWNDVVMLVQGHHHTFQLNGRTVMEFTDENPAKRMSAGELSFHLWNAEHPFARLQLKNIRYRPLRRPGADGAGEGK
jgi:class 3 adenylate cyclase